MSVWRMEYASQDAAKKAAGAIHDWLCKNNSDYCNSVAAGYTTGWAKPYQLLDDQGKALGTSWYLNIRDICLKFFTPEEQKKLVLLRKG